MYYRRKRNRGRIIALSCFLLLFAGLVYGYLSNNKEPLSKPYGIEEENIKEPLEDKSREKDQEISENNLEESEAQETSRENDDIVDSQETSDSNLTSPNTQIIFNTYYTKTGDMVVSKRDLPVTLVGLRLSEFKDYIDDYYSEWKIKSISPQEVTLFQEKDSYTPNQFIIQEKDGYIAVYRINDQGEKILHYETDIALSLFNEIDRRKLKEGIVVKNFDEALSIIQDYSS